jgi:hypothetical protein
MPAVIPTPRESDTRAPAPLARGGQRCLAGQEALE